MCVKEKRRPMMMMMMDRRGVKGDGSKTSNEEDEMKFRTIRL